MNRIFLMGRMVREPELRKTQSDISVCSFTIAVNRDYGEGADFVSCTAWKKAAELIAKHFTKGSNILIEGSLQSRKYKDKSGNERTAWEVQVDKLHFVDSKKKSDDQPQFEEAEIDDGTLPF